MNIEIAAISALHFDPANARKHGAKNLQAIKGSLAKFGQQKPIVVDAKGVVIAGNGTLAAAKELGWTEIKIVRTDLVGPEAIAFALADNRAAELAEWDDDILGPALQALREDGFDIASIGFDIAEAMGGGTEGLTDPDDVPETPKDVWVKAGDLFELGNHRLLCGDSTKREDVDRLMAGEKADMCFTSPPYNLGDNAKLRGYNGDGDDSAYSTKSDHKTSDEYLEFLSSFTSLSLTVSDTVFVNIQCLAGNKFVIPKYWMKFHEHLIDLAVWDKEHAPPQMAARVLNSVWEFIFIFGSQSMPTRSMKHGPDFRGNVDNIYRLNPVGKKDPLAKDHGAVFPVAFCEHFISKFSDAVVYEPFCGSGSTLIACEKTGRRCYGMEIDPGYCQVILERWAKFSGKEWAKL
jgi:DNA modification methylase